MIIELTNRKTVDRKLHITVNHTLTFDLTPHQAILLSEILKEMYRSFASDETVTLELRDDA
jgi:hypothetical protein